MLAAHRCHRFFAAVAGAEILSVAMNDRIAQLNRPTNRCVFAEVGLDRSDRRILHMLRRGEMRLTGCEVNHLDSLLAQFFGFRRRCHGGGGLNAVDAIG